MLSVAGCGLQPLPLPTPPNYVLVLEPIKVPITLALIKALSSAPACLQPTQSLPGWTAWLPGGKGSVVGGVQLFCPPSCTCLREGPLPGPWTQNLAHSTQGELPDAPRGSLRHAGYLPILPGARTLQTHCICLQQPDLHPGPTHAALRSQILGPTPGGSTHYTEGSHFTDTTSKPTMEEIKAPKKVAGEKGVEQRGSGHASSF